MYSATGRGRLCIFVSLIIIMLNECRMCCAATHWMVTEDGLLSAVQDSHYNLRAPHNLVELMRQEDRVKFVETATADMNLFTPGGKSTDSGSKSPPAANDRTSDKESKRTDECAGLTDVSLRYLLTSSAITLEKLGFDLETFVGQPTTPPSDQVLLKPYCTKIMRLPFSMSAFEHLDTMKKRSELDVGEEQEIAPFLHPGWKNTQHFGHFVMLNLKENYNSWVLYNLATFYWRIVGNAHQAVECIRRALHLTPRRFMSVPLLNLANILVAAGEDEEAVVVLDTLLAFNDTIAAAYCKSAEAYAGLYNYNASVFAYEACLLLDPTFPGAQQHQTTVQCHIKRLQSGDRETELHSKIELDATYQSKLLEYQKVHERVLNAMADPDTKRQMTLTYDYFTLGQLETLKCAYRSGKKTGDSVDCQVADWDAYKLIKNLHHETKFGFSPTVLGGSGYRSAFKGKSSSKSNSTSQSASSQSNMDADQSIYKLKVKQSFEAIAEKERSLHTLPSTYPITNKQHFYPADYVFEDEDWPGKKLCSRASLPKRQELPRLFMSPVDKGYDLPAALTNRLLLKDKLQHPLPWYPPICESYPEERLAVKNRKGNKDPDPDSQPLACCDHLLGVQRVLRLGAKDVYQETSLTQTLLNLTGLVLDSPAEIGQRLLTAMQLQLAPAWMLRNAAALYWRVLGNPLEASRCIRLVLADANSKPFHAITLVQLAQLVELAGERVDDAIVLIRQAVAIDVTQPWPHFLLAHYLVQNSNLTGATFHLLQALNVDPSFPGALQLMKAVKCELKFNPPKTVEGRSAAHAAATQNMQKGAIVPFGLSPQQLMQRKKYFCFKDFNQMEMCYVEQECDQSLVMRKEEPICVPPPALAPFFFKPGLPPPRPSELGLMDRQRQAAGYLNSLGSKASLSSTQYAHTTSQTAQNNVFYDADYEALDVQMDTDIMDTNRHKDADTTFTSEDTDDATAMDQQHLSDSVGVELTLDHDNSAVHNKEQPIVPNVPPPSRLVVQYDDQGTAHLDIDESVTEPMSMSAATDQPISDELNPLGMHADVLTEDMSPMQVDTTLPDVLPNPTQPSVLQGASHVHSLPTSSVDCAKLRSRIDLEQPTSTWLSVTAKGVKIEQLIDFQSALPVTHAKLEPHCPQVSENNAWSLDHLSGFAYRDQLWQYKPERGLKDAFENLGVRNESIEAVAYRLTIAMQQSALQDTMKETQSGGVHWALSTVAALYWRVQGDAPNALRCLRHSLANCPLNMRDLALVSMANVYHQAGMLHSALIAGGAALTQSPRFVVIHFTLANVYSSLGRMDLAMQFYFSTLGLQPNFEPARDRIRTIYCMTGRLPKGVKAVVSKKPASDIKERIIEV